MSRKYELTYERKVTVKKTVCLNEDIDAAFDEAVKIVESDDLYHKYSLEITALDDKDEQRTY